MRAALVGARPRVAGVGQTTAAEIRATIRASPRVAADETGLRQDGGNGYRWSFHTERERSFVRGGRNTAVVDEVLGPDFARVRVSDCSAAADPSAGPHQRCWAHRLRDLHDLTERRPKDAALQTWASQVHGVYERACRAQLGPAAHRPTTQPQCAADLLGLCQPDLDAAAAMVPQAGRCRPLQQ